MLKFIVLVSALLLGSHHTQASSEIKKGMVSFSVELNGSACTIKRNQTKDHKIHPLYETTDRGKPTPIKLAPGIETLGELEFIDYMIEAQFDESIMVIDTRTEKWHQSLRIPCTKNIPFMLFNDNEEIAILTLLDEFGVEEDDAGNLDFSNAKTVVGYCNGFWCGQTPGMFVRARYSLLNIGYPAEKLKYYRGGMQAWTALGFTVEGDDL